MKIAICVNGRAHEGGVTTFINTIVGPLRQLGHTTDVITLFGVSEYRQLRPNFVSKTDILLKGSNLIAYLAYRLSQVALSFHLHKAFFKNRYDVIYAIDVSSANAALAIKRFHKVKVFLRVGSSVVKDLLCQGKITEKGFAIDFLKWQEIKAYTRVDGVIPNGTWSRDYVSSICPDARLLDIVYSPVDEEIFSRQTSEAFSWRSKLNLADDDFVILYPSRMAKRKGPKIALQALEILLNTNKRFKLLYIGEGPEEEAIAQYARDRKLDDKVSMLGVIPHRKIAAFYHISNVAVIPSVSYKDYEEPLSNSCLEAMASGVPVIASAIGGLKDFIDDGVNGLLVPENNPEKLAESITLISNDDSVKKTLIKGGLETIRCNNHPIDVARILERYFLEKSID